jgi:hypothetical protein
MWLGTEARSDIIKAVRTSMAYMHKEAVAPLHELPFSATQGDVRTRVDEIAAMPQPPAGTLGAKLHFCCRFFRDEAIAALELMREAPFSVQLVEKGHSAGAFIRRAHPLVGSDNLQSRAFLCESRVLVRSRRGDTVEELEQQFGDALAKSKKVQYSARNAFCSLVATSSASGVAAGAATGLGQRMMRRCITEHNSRFDKLSMDARAAYQNLASQVRLQRSSARLVEAQHVHATWALRSRRLRFLVDTGFGEEALPPTCVLPLVIEVSLGHLYVSMGEYRDCHGVVV